MAVTANASADSSAGAGERLRTPSRQSTAALLPAPKIENTLLLYASLFLVGFALRFGFVLWARTYVGSAQTSLPFGAEIGRLAAHIAAGAGFRSPFHDVDTGPSAWVAPVYPYLVAAVFRLFGAYSPASAVILLGLQCAMAAATGVVIYKLGVRTLGERIGFWAAVIWTCSPIFFRWPTSLIWDFSASAFLLALSLVMTLDTGEKGTSGRWLRLGGIWGLMALTNPALLTLLPFSLLHAAWENRKVGVRFSRGLAYTVILFSVLISPWLIRNFLVFHRPVFLRDNYWFEFSMGNYHYSNGMGWSGKHPDVNPLYLNQVAKLGELGFIDLHKREALNFVRKYPGEFADLTLHRVLWFWDGTTIIYQANDWWQPWRYWPLSATAWLGLFFALTRRPRGWTLYGAALLFYPLPYYLAYPHHRYRHAIEPELLLLTVYLASVLCAEVARLFAPKQRQA
jgi:4-amino-4-deoxy-L-arabinose transferase-like glycosyltransferase